MHSYVCQNNNPANDIFDWNPETAIDFLVPPKRQSLKIGITENMAYFDCEKHTTKYVPLGRIFYVVTTAGKDDNLIANKAIKNAKNDRKQ